MPPTHPDKKSGWPMPFSELISRRDLYKKRVHRAQIIGFVIYFIGNAILPPETWFKPGFQPIGPTAPAAYYTMFFLFLGVIAFLIWNSRRIARKLGLSCPQCHQLFAKEHLMAHTVASGKCPRCSAEIISDHPSTRELPPNFFSPGSTSTPSPAGA